MKIDHKLSFMVMTLLVVLFCCDRERDSIYDSASDKYEPEIVRVESEGESVTVYSETGRSIWSLSFDAVIGHTAIADIDGDGRKDAVLALGDGAEEAGFIYVFDYNRNKILEYAPPDTNVYVAAMERNKFRVNGLVVDDLYEPGEPFIIATWVEVKFYASRLSIISRTGQTVGEYWNPGHIGTPQIADVDNNGVKEILISGTNNDLRQIEDLADGTSTNFHYVSLLEISEVAGQAPPYLAVGIPRARENWYLMIYPQGASASVVIQDFFPSHPGLEFEVHVSPIGLFWYLDSSSKVLRVGIGDVEEAPQQAFLVRIIDSKVTKVFADGTEEIIGEFR